MDHSSFDRLTRMLGSGISRRAGIAALIAGVTGSVASTADARRGAGQRHDKLACRNDQSECTANEQCCSGICKAKPGSGTDFRCVGKHKKKDKKKNGGGGGGDVGPTCIPENETCPLLEGCCADLVCYPSVSAGATCKECGEVFDYCNVQSGAPCCDTMSCEGIGGMGPFCCIAAGFRCDASTECCRYGIDTTCINNECVQN